MACNTCGPAPVAMMPSMQPMQMAPAMSPQAMKHQHVVNHLACREAACPQGIDPHNVAVWGARRDGMERIPCPEPAMQVVPQMQQPMQMCCPPMGGTNMGVTGAVAVGSGWSAPAANTSSVSFIDWGGRWSASPEYDAKGSPHGYYGPPAVAAMLQNGNGPCAPGGMMGGGAAMAGGQCCVPGMGGGMGYPNHFGNAYPGPQSNRTHLPDTTQDSYYQRREHETRTGFLPGPKVPQGTAAYFPSQPTEPGRYQAKPASPVATKTTTTVTKVSSSPHDDKK